MNNTNAGKGWHGNTPGHKAAATKADLKDTLRVPPVQPDTTYSERERRLLAAMGLLTTKEAPKSSKNKIYSTKNWEILLYEAVLEYARDFLGIQSHTIELKLNDNLSTKWKGTISLNKSRNIVTINNVGIDANIASIFHELTHIKQKLHNELTFENNYLVWKQKPIISNLEYKNVSRLVHKEVSNYNIYNNLPWEQEARNTEKRVAVFFRSKYLLNLKGKDSNIDFIIDNHNGASSK